MTHDRIHQPEDSRPIEISPEALAAIGGGEWAYLRKMTGAEIRAKFPGAPDVSAETDFFAVFGADGTPLALADTQQAALANMVANDLTPVAVH
jgi:hypothetical protein